MIFSLRQMYWGRLSPGFRHPYYRVETREKVLRLKDVFKIELGRVLGIRLAASQKDNL